MDTEIIELNSFQDIKFYAASNFPILYSKGMSGVGPRPSKYPTAKPRICIPKKKNATHNAMYSYPIITTPVLVSPAPPQVLVLLHLKRGTALSSSSHTTQQPIREPHELGAHAPLPLAAALDMLDCMAENPPLAVKLEDKQPGEPLLRLLVAGLEQLAERQPPAYAGATGSRPPPDHKLLGARALALALFLEHALRQDLEPHVADDRQAVPRDRRGPQRGCVGDAPRNGREVRVGRGEEVEADVGREDLLRER